MARLARQLSWVGQMMPHSLASPFLSGMSHSPFWTKTPMSGPISIQFLPPTCLLCATWT